MKTSRTGAFFLAFLLILGVFLLNMTFAGRLSSGVLLLTRVLLTAVFAAGILVFRMVRNDHARKLSFILMTVNLAFLVVSFFTTGFWGIDLQTPAGIAYAKLSDSVIISLVLLAMFFLGGYRPKDVYLATGRLVPGLIIGILAFILMGFLAMNNPDQPLEAGFLRSNLLWILVFVFSNAFMEELLFRGILLKPLGGFMKPVWAIVLTSVVFAAAHLQVTYTPDVLFFAGITLVLGLIWGWLMHFTRSLIASVLFHAGADLIIIVPIFNSLGASG
jgi:membrane protease YdiL (CAAX protease family)